MIVVDSSAVIASLLRDGPARTAMTVERVHVLHLLDSEVTNGLRRLARGDLEETRAAAALSVWRAAGVERHAVLPLLSRVWELRDNLTAYDAGHLALAESLACALVTADARLARANGVRCAVTVVPR